jgi:hypothetical protein
LCTLVNTAEAAPWITVYICAVNCAEQPDLNKRITGVRYSHIALTNASFSGKETKYRMQFFTILTFMPAVW